MDVMTAQRLSQLTSDFYAQVGESFSATRQAPWAGWERVLVETRLARDLAKAESGLSGDAMQSAEVESGAPQRVLDLACGNLRFERYLAETLAPRKIQATCIDSCDELASPADVSGLQVEYIHCDIAEALSDERLADTLGKGCFDLAVCFGFLHHLPLASQRTQLLRALVASVRQGGFVAVSLWQLGHSPELLTKAKQVTAEMAPALGICGLGEGDYLLGWQGRTDALRFCHDFSETEVAELAASVYPYASATASFSADGRTSNLNRYLVFERL